MNLKEKLYSLINVRLFIIITAAVSVLMYLLMIIKPGDKDWVYAFNYAILILYVPSLGMCFIGRFQKQIMTLLGGGFVTKEVEHRDGSVTTYMEVAENQTWREAERNLRITWFLSVMGILYYLIFGIYYTFFRDASAQTAKKATKTNGEIILIVIGVIIAIVVFFGAAAYAARMIEKKNLKKGFYAVFAGLFVSFIIVNFGSIIGWLFS